MGMVHDDLAAAADQLAALTETATTVRRQAMRCVLELSEQCAPGAAVSANALAGMMALLIGDEA